jgi:hypothetical protein
VRNWGLDRIDQTALPMDSTYAPGDLDGSGSHIYVLVSRRALLLYTLLLQHVHL